MLKPVVIVIHSQWIKRIEIACQISRIAGANCCVYTYQTQNDEDLQKRSLLAELAIPGGRIALSLGEFDCVVRKIPFNSATVENSEEERRKAEKEARSFFQRLVHVFLWREQEEEVAFG
jgi:hypothetical protein